MRLKSINLPVTSSAFETEVASFSSPWPVSSLWTILHSGTISEGWWNGDTVAVLYFTCTFYSQALFFILCKNTPNWQLVPSPLKSTTITSEEPLILLWTVFKCKMVLHMKTSQNALEYWWFRTKCLMQHVKAIFAVLANICPIPLLFLFRVL